MTYTKQFDPNKARLDSAGTGATSAGDRRDGSVYVYSDDIVLAVNVALAVGRPLLVSGPPGSGKSSLAPNVAQWLGWRYLSETVTSRTQARDLLWRFDAVRRLSDAQAHNALDQAAYVEPGTLWWAFDPETATTRGTSGAAGVTAPVVPGVARDSRRAVVLIDEIDKADPDIPNSLLEALGSMQFTVDETEFTVTAHDDAQPFVVITTNDERELPKAFVRRCAAVTLAPPGRDRLLAIADAHFPAGNAALHEQLADLVLGLAKPTDGSQPPSTAEFIDAIRACETLGVALDGAEFENVRTMLLAKHVSPTA